MAYLSIDDYSKKTGISRDEILQGIEDGSFQSMTSDQGETLIYEEDAENNPLKTVFKKNDKDDHIADIINLSKKKDSSNIETGTDSVSNADNQTDLARLIRLPKVDKKIKIRIGLGAFLVLLCTIGISQCSAFFAEAEKERQERVEAEKKQEKAQIQEAHSYGFVNYETYINFQKRYELRSAGALDEALSEHRRAKETEGRKLGFDSLTQYMDALTQGFHNREEWDVSRLSPEQIKLELAKEAEIAEIERKNREAKNRADRELQRKKNQERLIAERELQKKKAEAQLEAERQKLARLEAQEKERAARDREGKGKLAASFGFDNFEEYDSFIKLNRGTSDKRLLKYKKTQSAKARRARFDSLAQYMAAKSNGFAKRQDWEDFLSSNTGYDLAPPDWRLSPSEFVEGHFSAAACKPVISKDEMKAREGAMQMARKDIASYVFGVDSETSMIRNQLPSVYMKESSLWLRDGQPMVCVLASINHMELQNVMNR